MVTVLIVHSALGLRPAITELAETVIALGHSAVAPDFFGGQTFGGGATGYEEALAHLKEHGQIAGQRVEEAYAALPGPVVTLGFSWGAGHAQRLAEREERIVGTLLVGGGERYGGEWDDGGRWRCGTPLACHWMVEDPWLDTAAHAALVTEAASSGSDVSDYVYPGDGHLFMDAGLPEEYSREAAELFRARVEGFLSRFL